MEKKFIPSIYRALKGQISSFTSDLKSGGLSYARRRLDDIKIDPLMSKAIKRIHRQAGLFTALRVRDHLRVSKKAFGFSERMVKEIQEYFRIFLLEKAVLPISETSKARINTILDKAISEGWSVDKILEELGGEVFGEMTKRRARMIVRTEVVRASNFGGMAAAFDSDYEIEKQWNEIKDFRTRISHRHGSGVGGQKRDLLSPYSNGGQFPGDPELPPGESINCRCVNTYRLKRDKHGNPIPKRPVLVGVPRESLANILAIGAGILLGNLLSENV
jgi:hypothetical protein